MRTWELSSMCMRESNSGASVCPPRSSNSAASLSLSDTSISCQIMAGWVCWRVALCEEQGGVSCDGSASLSRDPPQPLPGLMLPHALCRLRIGTSPSRCRSPHTSRHPRLPCPQDVMCQQGVHRYLHHTLPCAMRFTCDSRISKRFCEA